MWKTRIKDTALPLFLVANSITWFSVIWLVIGTLTENTSEGNNLVISVSYFGAVMISAVIGATLLQKKLRKKTPLTLWIVFGAVSSIVSAVLIHDTNMTYLPVISIVLGIAAGLGIPSCLAFFGNHTDFKNRGKTAGVLYLVIQIFSFIIFFFTSELNIEYVFVALSIWRLLALVSISFWKSPNIQSEKIKNAINSIIRERKFFLYFVPWILFTLINFVEAPLLQTAFGSKIFNDYMWIDNILSCVSGVIAGVICDLKGRKLTIISGFILLGLGYGFLSVLAGTQFSQFLYVFFDGMAWGILYVTFIYVIWGDISEGKNSEKYYLLGGLPFLFSGITEALVQPFVKYIPISTSFSFASFFLFVAIIPLLYAPETLPEKAMKERDLKSYLEKAQKIAQKGVEKKQKKETKKKQEEPEESEGEKGENNEEYDEARKLAEKYY